MATRLSRLALTASLAALFGSGCTLHVVSGPVSQQRADHEYYYSMAPQRALRPASGGPVHAHHPKTNGARRLSADSEERRAERPSGSARTGSSAGQDENHDRVSPGVTDRSSLRAPRRSALADQIANDPSKRPTKRDKRREQGDETQDDSGKLRYPYWVSVNENERIDVEGTPVRPDARRGRAKDFR